MMAAFRTVTLLAFGLAGVAATVEHFGLWPWLVVPGTVLVVACEVWHRGSAVRDSAEAGRG